MLYIGKANAEKGRGENLRVVKFIVSAAIEPLFVYVKVMNSVDCAKVILDYRNRNICAHSTANGELNSEKNNYFRRVGVHP